jgi:NADH:ubiquinone oxidoreductase subunit 6 (subunit J)
VSRKVVLGVVGAAGAVAFVFLIVVMARQGLTRAGAWAGPLGALASLVAAVAAAVVLVPRRQGVALPPEPEVALPPEPDAALPRRLLPIRDLAPQREA